MVTTGVVEKRSWSFKTNVIVLSEDLDGGSIRISADIASKLSAQPGSKVTVTHAGRSVPARLLISAGLEREEVELNAEDLKLLGVEEGTSGHIEILSCESDGTDGSSPHAEAAPRARVPPHLVRAPVERADRVDEDSPPYVVESGLGRWGFLKRRKKQL